MAIQLNPAPIDLGIMAPFLGPWFKPATLGNNPTLPLPKPSGHLGLTIDLGEDGTQWLPPATGVMSLFIAKTTDPPLPIAHLQSALGEWPFADGDLVAYFRLLPEVEERLHSLSRLIPPVTGPTVPTPPTAPFAVNQRARVRSFALVPGLETVDHDAVMTLMGGETNVPGDTNLTRLKALGLDTDGLNVSSDKTPMTRLRRPGIFKLDPQQVPTQQDAILHALAGNVQLWAFDHRGRALDPGAVAAWWSWLLNRGVGASPSDPGDPFQLLAPGINPLDLPQEGGQRLVCAVEEGRHAQLVDAHDSRLRDPFLGDRLLVDGDPPDETLLTAGDSGLQLSFQPLDPPTTPPPTDNPPVDSAPRPRIAVLPAGPYGPTLTLWPDGEPITPGLERDFVRVSVIDEELHLVGIPRGDSRATATNADERRRSDQNRPSTRVNVERTATNGPVLLATADEAQLGLDAVLTSPGTLRAVLGVADAEAGAIPGPALLTTSGGAFPVRLVESGGLAEPGTYRVRALVGGGPIDGDQAVLLEVELGAAHDGTWLRAWPLGFNLETGLRPRITGGGGRVLNGRATVVMTLPPGQVSARGLLSFDAQLSRLDAAGEIVSRVYADCRFERPTAVAGNPETVIAGTWAICETGVTGTGALPAAAMPPGASVVLTGNPAAIVDRRAVPAASRTPETLMNRLASGDVLSLTAPAFGSTPDRADALGRPILRAIGGGDRTGGLASLPGVIVHHLDRDLAGASASSAPLALQDRLEVVAAKVTAQPAPAAVAALTGGPRLPLFHEQLPHLLGHPGVRAAIETHATGVLLDGPPALEVAAYARERTAGLGFDLVSGAAEPQRSIAVQSELAVAAEATAAAITLPAVLPPGPGPGPVVAILRTNTVGQEGIPGLALAASTLAVFPLSQHGSELQNFLNDTNLPAGGGPLGNFLRSQIGNQFDAITRALDRRLLVGQRGAREAAFSIAAAFGRAQDLVYIETPALDRRAHGPDDDRLDLLGTLIDRLGVKKGLRVIICTPARLAFRAPKKLQAIRDFTLLAAINELRAVAADRIAVFSPGVGAGRALRMATTTVVVDDVFSVTGTTHLWRRGLTFDSSLAAAVFDERLSDGRPQEVRGFRRQLLADRLGVPFRRLPDDPDELVRAIRQLDETAPADEFGTRPSQRRSAIPILAPDPTPTDTDVDTWNPDGSRGDLDLAALLGVLALTDPDHAIVDD
jgi:hypothetical protein